MRRHPLSMGALVVAVAGVAACGSSSSSSSSGTSASAGPAGYSGHTIEIGAVVSQAGAGAIYAKSQMNGIRLAVDTLNKAGVGGAQIHVDIVDDNSDKAQAAQQFQTLIQQKNVLALLGPTLSNQAVGAHPVADQAQTPVVAISNTGIGIVGNCPYPCDYIFRDSLGEESAVPADVRTVVASSHPRSAVIMYANDDKFSSDDETIFKKALSAGGVSLASEVSFSKNETDVSSLVTEALGNHPDLLVVSTLGGLASKITIEARKQGFSGPMVGGNGFNTSAVSSQSGDAGKGVDVASAYYVGSTNAANQSFVSDYRTAYGSAPDQIAAQAYLGVVLIAEAAKSAGLGFGDVGADRTKLRDALAKLSLADSPLGPFSFTSAHDVRQPIYIVTLDGKGGFTLVTTVQPS